MSETPKSPFVEHLRSHCPQCGVELPCPLHDQSLIRELLKPREQPYPWDKLEKNQKKEWDYGNNILTSTPLSETQVLVGGGGGQAQLWEIPESALESWKKAQVALPKVPPLPPLPR